MLFHYYLTFILNILSKFDQNSKKFFIKMSKNNCENDIIEVLLYQSILLGEFYLTLTLIHKQMEHSKSRNESNKLH